MSQICEELKIHPNMLYQWQKNLFANGEEAFKKDNNRIEKQFEKEIDNLQDKLAHKDNVISEIMSEFMELKKKSGGR